VRIPNDVDAACKAVDEMDGDNIAQRVKCIPYMIRLVWAAKTVEIVVYPGHCTDMMGACREAERLMEGALQVVVTDRGHTINIYSKVAGVWRCIHWDNAPIEDDD